jgi:hypothetical protein
MNKSYNRSRGGKILGEGKFFLIQGRSFRYIAKEAASIHKLLKPVVRLFLSTILIEVLLTAL